MTNKQIDRIVSDSEGHWKEDVFQTDGSDLANMLRKAYAMGVEDAARVYLSSNTPQEQP